jgi:hypothetical protein
MDKPDRWFRPNWQNVHAGGTLVVLGIGCAGFGIWLIMNGAWDAANGMIGR